MRSGGQGCGRGGWDPWRPQAIGRRAVAANGPRAARGEPNPRHRGASRSALAPPSCPKSCGGGGEALPWIGWRDRHRRAAREGRTMHPSSPKFRLPPRGIVAGILGLSLVGGLAYVHAPRHDGVGPDDLDAVPADPSALGPEAGQWLTGALVVDYVDPQEGEGGSDEEIEAHAAGLAGVDAAPAGFYAEAEHLYRIEGPRERLAELARSLSRDPLVECVEWETVYRLPEAAVEAAPTAVPAPAKPAPDRFVPDDPMFGLQWHMEQIRAPEAWTKTRGSGVVVAVIDTGVAYKDAAGVRGVPDLAGTKIVDGKTFVSGGAPDGLDDHAHGTHVAGTIAQTTNNGIGVAGVAHEAAIMPLKVLSARGSGSVTAIANAVRYAADHGAHVINMSLGGPFPSKVLAKAVAYAHDKGVTVVCASGNDHRSRVGYPAANEGAVAVGAVDYEGKLTFYSNWGDAQDVTAPGGDTRSDKNGDGYPDGVLQNTIQIGRPAENGYLWFQGTSMASPHAAGVAALVVSEGVTNPDEVERILKETARHPEGRAWDPKYGAGIVDAAAAVEAARSDYDPERLGFFGIGLLAAGGVGARRLRRRWVAAGGAVALGALSAVGVIPELLAGGVGGAASLLGTALGYSALVPLVAVVALLSLRWLRPALAALALGYGAFLAHGAVVLPTLLTAVPGAAPVDRLFLAVHAILAVFVGLRVAAISRRNAAA
ncbi:MAG: peptidase S8 [Deltaproteobacteria bacterium]|nr:MAG: peptidase S8 [Deltaproteobacteria bacterium]